jgi:hypothetical protein
MFFDIFVERWNVDMRFGTWNVERLYRAGSLVSVSKQLPKYKLDFVRVQEVRWEGGGTETAGEYTFFYGKGNEVVSDRLSNRLCGLVVRVPGCGTEMYCVSCM